MVKQLTSRRLFLTQASALSKITGDTINNHKRSREYVRKVFGY
jgi:hypothetical protein